MAATILTAAVLAFFGYVLEILVEVYEQVFHVRHELAEAADERWVAVQVPTRNGAFVGIVRRGRAGRPTAANMVAWRRNCWISSSGRCYTAG